VITENLKLKTENYRKNFFVLGYSLVICLLVYWFIGLLSPKANASTASNNNYNIDVQDINIDPENSLPSLAPAPQIFITPSPAVPEILTNNSSISFSLDNEIIDFGPLSPGNPVERAVNLTITNNQTNYFLTALENHPLLAANNATIPDTTCDDGECSETTESIWTSNLTYGFGFRCDGQLNTNCIGFSDQKNYKQFANTSKNEKVEEVLTGNGNAVEKAKLTLKINVPSTQKTGNYNNNINLIVIPGY
jgi:hypothetical protein